jgi:aldehyde dehydrogenase (NAD+)
MKILEHFNLSSSKTNSGVSSGNQAFKHYEESDSIISYNPYSEKKIAKVSCATEEQLNQVINNALVAFHVWRETPAPKRGLLVKTLGRLIEDNKIELAELIACETGKIIQESLGEVQEAIDICDFAVGLSRQLYGLSMHSERPYHRMYEQWHPLGPIGVITAFNFPIAVWAWNAAIAAVCGNTIIWKPSEKAPLTALAIQHLCSKAQKVNSVSGVFNLAVGEARLGQMLANDERISLLSATGSTKMGKSVNLAVAARFGRSLLELGGNNAVIIDDSADLDLATKGIFFGAVGTAGQRCTTTRRLFVHKSVINEVITRLKSYYDKLVFGDPLDQKTMIGPLIDANAVAAAVVAVEQALEEGAKLVVGGQALLGGGYFFKPTIILLKEHTGIVKEETFAPILYIIEFDELSEAIALQNDVIHGLSSAIYTARIEASERFLSAAGSDCGIANVNIGTSGAEIGGAFGGEKATGGGREAGSDAWKFYMRRQTNTINWSKELPLAQGIQFGSV